MRKFMVVTAVVAGLAFLFAASMVTSASASSGTDSVAAWNTGETVSDGPDHPGRPGGPGRPGHPGGPRPTGEPGEPRPTRVPGEPRPTGEPGSGLMCREMAQAVHTACPCNGPDGNGWASHEAFVTCVTNAANAAVAGGGAQECADKLIERATNSKVGTEGFECKPIGERPEGPGRPGRPGHPGGGRGPHPTPEPTALP